MVFARPQRQCWDVLLSLQLLGLVRVKKLLMKRGHLLWTGRGWDESEEDNLLSEEGQARGKKTRPIF